MFKMNVKEKLLQFLNKGEDPPGQHQWTLSELTGLLIGELKEKGKERTARAYATVLHGVTRYNGGEELCMDHLSRDFLCGYESYMKRKGNSLNTVSFYMRNLRAIYNKGVKRGLYTPSRINLFEEVYTGVDKTPKRAIVEKEVRALEHKAEEIRARQASSADPYLISLYYFLFCFYARGMSFVDMAFLRKADITNEVIRYKRIKTGQQVVVRLMPEMKQILRFFQPMVGNSPFLFPVISDPGKDVRVQYESGLRVQNKRLKRIALMCGIKQNLSTHVARHSWASLAKKHHVPLEVISEGLGHTSVKTTAIYLSSFEQQVLDRANRKVVRAVKKSDIGQK